MAWKIEISDGARKMLRKLDQEAARRILRFLKDQVAVLEDPRRIGKSLEGSTLGHYWRYRVGDYRIIADLRDEVVTVLIVRIGHRRDVYR